MSANTPRKANLTYDKFKKVWPFPWDTKPTVKENPEEGMLSEEFWNTILTKPAEDGGEASSSELSPFA